jgi:uncharacterized protein YndB with AHSA1/START domain
MMPGSPISTADRPSDREVVFRRLLDAPRELVWKCGATRNTCITGSVRRGSPSRRSSSPSCLTGVWRFIMHGPDGTDNPNLVVFREIVPPSRLVYENGWDLPGAPLDFVVVVTLLPEGKRTRFSIHMTFRDAAAMKTAVEL